MNAGARRIGSARLEARAGGFVAMADLHGHAPRRFQVFDGNPIDVTNFTRSLPQFAVFANDNAIRGAVEGNDIKRASRCDAEPLALPNCEMVEALMTAQHFATGGDNLAGLFGKRLSAFAEVRGDEP